MLIFFSFFILFYFAQYESYELDLVNSGELSIGTAYMYSTYAFYIMYATSNISKRAQNDFSPIYDKQISKMRWRIEIYTVMRQQINPSSWVQSGR